MRTPLNGILGSLDLLKETNLTSSQIDLLDAAIASGDAIAQNMNGMLEFTKMETDDVIYDRQAINFQELIETLVHNYKNSTKTNGNHFIFSSDELQDIYVAIDEQRVSYVINALLDNAVKFCNDGRITVSLTETNRSEDTIFCEVSISDTGVGISKVDQKHIFDPFYTSEDLHRRVASGIGIGLALCKRIVTHMGGTISVESRTGSGSNFTLEIPLRITEKQSTTPRIKATLPPQAAKNNLILLVDDSGIGRTVASKMLKQAGYQVSTAKTGFDAIELAQNTKFDAILMDISLPEMDGVEASYKIMNDNGKSQDSPIIALTAHALFDDIQRFKNAGMKEVITKPFKAKQLVQVLQAVISPDSNALVYLNTDRLSELRTLLGEKGTSTQFDRFSEEIIDANEQLNNSDILCDTQEIAKVAHKSIASSAMFGALPLSKHFRSIEKFANAKDSDNLKHQISKSDDLWEKTQVEIKTYLEL